MGGLSHFSLHWLINRGPILAPSEQCCSYASAGPGAPLIWTLQPELLAWSLTCLISMDCRAVCTHGWTWLLSLGLFGHCALTKITNIHIYDTMTNFFLQLAPCWAVYFVFETTAGLSWQCGRMDQWSGGFTSPTCLAPGHMFPLLHVPAEIHTDKLLWQRPSVRITS